MIKEFSKNERSPKCHFVNPSWFLSLIDLMTSSRHPTLTSRGRPRLRGVRPVWVCVCVYAWEDERELWTWWLQPQWYPINDAGH